MIRPRLLLSAALGAWVLAVTPAVARPSHAPSPFDADACLEDLRVASRAGPGASTARAAYLTALYSLGRTEEAVRGWREWIAADPTVPVAADRLYWFCLALMDTERTGEAAVLLEEARTAGLLDRERSYWTGMAKELLCAAYVELAEFDHARDLALEITRHGIVPEARILALYDLARAQEAMGEAEEANATWGLLAAVGGASPEATVAADRLSRVSSPPAVAPGALPAEGRVGQRCFHLGSWSERALAASQASKAAAAGVEVVTRADATPRGFLFTVAAGPFPTHEEAAAVRARLVARGITAIIEIDCAEPPETAR